MFKKACVLVLAVALVVLLFPVRVLAQPTGQRPDDRQAVLSAPVGDGWQSSDGKWYYFRNGSFIAGWQQIDGKWYYFARPELYAVTGLRQIEGYGYYFSYTNCAMLTGWQQINSKWYHFDDWNGVMAVGWQKIDNGQWYLFDTDGTQLFGWQRVGMHWYYLEPQDEVGNMIQSEVKLIDNMNRRFDDRGVWLGTVF